jgi:large subunit ribosomal protein L19
MVSKIVDKINREQMKKEGATPFRIGDAVKVHIKIIEGGKERIQVFSGTVIAKDGRGATETFTVRRISHGVGVEKIFPVHSQHVTKIDVTGSSRVRRAKLYFLRDRTGKQTRLKGKMTKPDSSEEPGEQPTQA